MPQLQDNLPELRDIHLPDGVSAFPLAYGWWVIGLSIIGAIVLIKVSCICAAKAKNATLEN